MSFFSDFFTRLTHDADCIRQEHVLLDQTRQANNERFERQRTDLIYLVKRGYEYQKDRDVWVKIERYEQCKYPGRYRLEVFFPSSYPESPPNIYAYPLGSGEYSEHILEHNMVCVASKNDYRPNSYWKSTMNAKGALILAEHVITGELERSRPKKLVRLKKQRLEGDIFEEIRRLGGPKRLIEYLNENTHLVLPLGLSWEEIASRMSRTDVSTKRWLVRYLQTKGGRS